MARILRGDIFWANLNPTVGNEQQGLRPVIIMSEDIFNEKSGTVIAIAITSQKPKARFPLTLELSSNDLPKKSWAKIGQIRTLSTLRLRKKIETVTSDELAQLLEGLNEILGKWYIVPRRKTLL